jgi:hypothetical protein
MTAAVSTLLEIGDLVRTRPGLDAPADVVAAWYEQKAVVLHHIATETGDPAAEQHSRTAHAHAAKLLADNVLLGGLPGQGKAAAVWAALPGGEVA